MTTNLMFSDYDMTEYHALPRPPENLSLSIVFATVAVLKWSSSEQAVNEFRIFVEPIESQWIWLEQNDTRLFEYEISGIANHERGYTLKNLLPDTLYSISMVCVNSYGTSNTSDVIRFTTLTGMPFIFHQNTDKHLWDELHK